MADVQFFEHPEYAAKKWDWKMYQDLFEGDHDVIVANEAYFWRHPIENHPEQGKVIRAIRAQLSRYLNLTEPAVSVWSGIFFKEDPKIDEVTDLFGDNVNDVDGDGTDLITFIKEEIFVPFVRDGRPIILTDAFEFSGQSKADEKQSGHRAFFEVLNVLDVKDWEIETKNPARRGKLNFLRYEYKVIEPRTSASDKPVVSTYSKVLFRDAAGLCTGTTFKSNKQNNQVGEVWEQVGEPAGFVGFTELPVQAFMKGKSWIKGACEQQLALFNHYSGYSNQLHNQAYQRVVIFTDDRENAAIALSMFTAALLPAGGSVHTIEPSNTQPYEHAIDRTVDSFFKVVFNQTKSLSAASKEAPGAETLKEMKEDLVSLVKSSITELENLVNKMVRDYAIFVGQKDFTGKITFSKDITTEDVTKMIEIYLAHQDDIKQILPWHQAYLKKVVDLQNFTPDEEDEIKKGIDAMKAETQPLAGTPSGNDPTAGAAATVDKSILRKLVGPMNV
jgi:hypothetical protein